MAITYHNNPRSARGLSWGELPEHCVGDVNAPLVTHCEKTGKFYFHEVSNAVACKEVEG